MSYLRITQTSLMPRHLERRMQLKKRKTNSKKRVASKKKRKRLAVYDLRGSDNPVERHNLNFEFIRLSHKSHSHR
jgi:hypothetical protein